MSASVDACELPPQGPVAGRAPLAPEPPAARVDHPEPRETSGMTSRLMLQYAEREGGRPMVDAVLRVAGCEHRRAELLDENAWFSFATKIALFEALAEVLDDPYATRHAGAAALEFNVAPGLKMALRALGSPGLVYRNVVRANAKFSARHGMEMLELAGDRARITFRDLVGGDVHRLDCEYTIGLLSCVPVLFGRAPARVTHPVCAVHGAERCIYEVSWDAGGLTPRAMLACGVTGGGALIGAALAAPALLPAAGVAAAGVAAVAGARALRAQGARQRRLETQLAEQAAVNARITGTLQELASELRVEELLDKIVNSARQAVGGKEFALLVHEDGALTCRSSSGLPTESIRTIEAWAARGGHDRSEPVVVEDATVVAELAPVAGHADLPMRSLCAVPLVFRGEAVGVLVALAPAARAFLPRDVDIVRGYGIQAAIALVNARMFATQHALATRDPLTGLLNHREFHESVERELERCRRDGGELSVALFDLDGFKFVNDGSGHAEGDRVLREVAAALAQSCRRSDVAFRVGGDEFALLLPGSGAADAVAVAERARDAICAADPRTSAACGVASWPRDGLSKDVLLAHADGDLYAMKSARRPAGSRRADGSGDPAWTAATQRERLAMASRLSAKLAPVLEADRIAAEAVRELCHSFDYFLAYVQRLDGATLTAIAVDGDVLDRRHLAAWEQGIDVGVCGRVARTRKVALVHNAALDPDHRGVEHVDPATDIRLRSQLAVPLIVADRVWGVLSLEDTELAAFGADDVLLLETVAAQVAAAVHRSELFGELEQAFTTTLGALCDALEAKDQYTASHAQAVGELARAVGLRLGLRPGELRDVEFAALLHDIGKIGIRSEVLVKPGRLDDEERAEMERHTVIGADLLARIPFFASVHPLVRSSHERWDGAGYPDRLAGEAIPLGARIISACDALHAMTSDRPYRAALPLDAAIAELRRCAGAQFDPGVVAALLATLDA